jgi:hypothetical protein
MFQIDCFARHDVTPSVISKLKTGLLDVNFRIGLRDALDSPQQQEDDQNCEYQTDSAGRSVTPCSAVWPSGNGADQHQDDDD